MKNDYIFASPFRFFLLCLIVVIIIIHNATDGYRISKQDCNVSCLSLLLSLGRDPSSVCITQTIALIAREIKPQNAFMKRKTYLCGWMVGWMFGWLGGWMDIWLVVLLITLLEIISSYKNIIPAAYNRIKVFFRRSSLLVFLPHGTTMKCES